MVGIVYFVFKSIKSPYKKLFTTISNYFTYYFYKDAVHSKEFKKRLEILEFNAKHTILERQNMARDVNWYKRHTFVSTPPIYISSTEGIGTPRVRTNHIDAVLDYFDEQEKLKLSGARIF